jgi:hypothetical protein
MQDTKTTDSKEPEKQPGAPEAPKDLVPDLVPEETEGEDKAETKSLPEPDSKSEQADDDSTPFDDEKTGEVIDEIVAKESDDLLAAQDAAIGKPTTRIKPKKRGSLLGRWWHNKWARSITLLLLFGGIAALLVVPKTRYLVLNTAGVRSSSSVVVVDDSTQLPLKGVEVKLGEQETKTDSRGRVQFKELELGPTKLVVSRVGFEEVQRSVIIGWGSNPFGTVALKASGVQYVIEVRDYLSDKPVEGVEATDGVEATAVSGKDGKITLTLSSAITAESTITLSRGGYRTEQIALDADPKKTTKASLVLDRKAVFMTKQSGKYDLYKSDIDGKNRELLLPGTGAETSNIGLAVSLDGKRAALVSTRENKRASDGSLLSTLVLIDVDEGDTVSIAEGAQLQLIDWIGSRLIFRQVAASSTAANRDVVVAYNSPITPACNWLRPIPSMLS